MSENPKNLGKSKNIQKIRKKSEFTRFFRISEKISENPKLSLSDFTPCGALYPVATSMRPSLGHEVACRERSRQSPPVKVVRQHSAPCKVAVPGTGGLKLENVPVRAFAGLDDANWADAYSAESGLCPASIATV